MMKKHKTDISNILLIIYIDSYSQVDWVPTEIIDVIYLWLHKGQKYMWTYFHYSFQHKFYLMLVYNNWYSELYFLREPDMINLTK